MKLSDLLRKKSDFPRFDCHLWFLKIPKNSVPKKYGFFLNSTRFPKIVQKICFPLNLVYLICKEEALRTVKLTNMLILLFFLNKKKNAVSAHF